MSSYTGTSVEEMMATVKDRFFYGLRRTANGELFIGKVDQMSKTDSLTVNNPGDPAQNYPDFTEGQDFTEGRDVFHNLVYENLNYEQYRWDTKNIWYYVNDEGELVARVNHKHTYDDNSSSLGLPVTENLNDFDVSVATGTNSYGTGNKYYIERHIGESPTLNLVEGQTYIFRQHDTSNVTHQILFSTTPNGTWGGGVEYTTGVVKYGAAGSPGAYTQITIAENAPVLYYYCLNHSGMGGQANTIA
jgi:hypothetical protein|tara:strand:- start:780 stop:1517 length:738 start_codon:yes stop_codon:yes gene_type:complete